MLSINNGNLMSIFAVFTQHSRSVCPFFHLLSRCLVYLPQMLRKNNKNQYSNCTDTNSKRGAALCKPLFLIASAILVQSTGVLQIIRIKTCFGVFKVQWYFRILSQKSLIKIIPLEFNDTFGHSLMWIPVYLFKVNNGFVVQSVTA